MGITTEQKYLLNRMNFTAVKVGLGDLIEGAETSAPADGSVTAAKLAADAVETAKIKDANVTKAKLAAGISAPLMVVAAGEFTTVGGDVNEQIAAAGVLGTDTVVAHIRKPGAVPVTLDTITPGADVIDLVFSGDPAADHIVGYVVLRATT